MIDNICRICLTTGVQQTHSHHKALQEYYSEIIDANINRNNEQENQFCSKCLLLLFQNFLFKEKCILAQKAMEEIQLTESEDNASLLNDIREKYKIKPNLSCKNMIETVAIEPDVHTETEIQKRGDTGYKNTDPLTELQFINRRIIICKHKEEESDTKINNDIGSDVNFKTETWIEIEDCESSLSNCEVKDTKGTQPKLKRSAVRKKPKKIAVTRKKESTINVKPQKPVLDTDEQILEYYLDQTKWQITKLSKEEVSLQFKNRTEMPTYKKSPHKCTLCFRGFLYSETLLRHNKTAHNEANMFMCKICKIRTVSPAKMKFHVFKHKYTYQCRECGFFTANLSSVKFHQETHESANKTCNMCGEVFLHSSTFYSHVREMHNSEHLCLMCGKSFVSALGVAFHMKRTHFIDYSRRARKRKLKQGGTEEDNRYHCDTCDVTFFNENAYKMHFVHSSKHNTQLLRFSKTAIIRRHRKGRKGLIGTAINTEEIEPGMVLCEICGKSVKVATLPIHKNTHTRQKLYSCSICQMEFVQKSSLNRHMARHTGDKAYKCDLCDKSYTQGGSLKLHVKTAHLNMPYPKRNRWNRKQTEPVFDNLLFGETKKSE